jgi:Na+/H+ antiporter NhaC
MSANEAEGGRGGIGAALRRGVLAALVLAVVLLLAQQAPPEAGQWYSLAPPLTAVCLAFATRRLLLALSLAVLLGGWLTVLPHKGADQPESWQEGVAAAAGFVLAAGPDPDHAVILGSVALMLGMIVLAIATGGFAALASRLARLARSRRSTNGCTVLVGLVLFFDDYANSVLIGSTMRPLADQQRISRAKLAFLIDATAAPVAGVALVSTWIGYEVGLFRDLSQQLHLGRDGFAMFLDALGFRFYCWLMIAFLLINVLLDRDFGPMARVERAAAAGRDPSRLPQEPTAPVTPRRNPWAALLPLSVFVGGILVGLWLDGGGPARLQEEGRQLWQIGYWRDVLGGVTRSVQVIAIAASAALFTGIVSARLLGGLRSGTILRCLVQGVRLSLYPSAILLLAWSLQQSCAALRTGEFLATTLQGNIAPFLFPVLLFVLAAAVSFATGTSWGTMAILIPTAIPVAFQLDQQTYGLITIMSLGAVLDGAIFGDHCSPISDTTILSATSSGCPLMVHTYTQLPYGLVVAGAAVAFGYLPAALWECPWAASLLAGILLFGAIHYYWGDRVPAPASRTAGTAADAPNCIDPPHASSSATESQAADTSASPAAEPSASPPSVSGASACDSPPKKTAPTEPPPASQH